jgi:hypothetical protein
MEQAERSNHEVVTELRRLLQGIKEHVETPLELPEPAMKLDLDLDSRESDAKRLAKHLQQMSIPHGEAFRRTNQIKSAYLGQGYLDMADALNPLGIYAFARSLLEFHAFIHYVSGQLRRIAASDKSWRDRGNEFFRLLVRARYASSAPDKRAALLSDGIPEKDIKPIHINDCLRSMQSMMAATSRGCSLITAAFAISFITIFQVNRLVLSA